MIQNNSPLPFYSSLSKQNHRQDWSGNKLFDLISPSNTFLPIQIQRSKRFDEISSIKLYDGLTGDYEELIDPTGKYIFGTGFNGIAKTIAKYGEGYLVGGTFTTYKGVSCHKLVLIDKNGDIDGSFNYTGTDAVNRIFVNQMDVIVSSYSGSTYTIDFVDSTGAQISALLPIILNNKVKNIIAGETGFYVCGDFTTSTKYAGSPVTTYGLMHLNADYTRDETHTFNFVCNGTVNDCALQSDGKLIIVGSFTTIQYTTVRFLARILTTGIYDISDPTHSFDHIIDKVVVNSDDTVVVAGQFTTYVTSCKRIAVLTSGLVLTTYGDVFDYDITILEKLGDKLIVVSNNTLYRLNTDLSVDATFLDNNNFYVANTIYQLLPINFANYMLVGDMVTTGLYPTNIRQNTYNGSVDIGSYFNIRNYSDDIDILIYNDEYTLRAVMGAGYKYLIVSDGVDEWVSEVFLVRDDISDCILITFYDTDNLLVDNGDSTVIYNDFSTSGFKNKIYLLDELQHVQIGHPDYILEETVIDRDGRMFFESQHSYKRYKFSIVLPEFLIDVLNLARISDFVTVNDNDNTYILNYLKFKETWINQTNLANIEFEMYINNISKKTGKINNSNQGLGIGEMVIGSTFIVR